MQRGDSSGCGQRHVGVRTVGTARFIVSRTNPFNRPAESDLRLSRPDESALDDVEALRLGSARSALFRNQGKLHPQCAFACLFYAFR
jgi:hypothetical protein